MEGLAPQTTNTIYISMEFPAYAFTNGSYRIVKQLDNFFYTAAFELGQSAITAERLLMLYGQMTTRYSLYVRRIRI